MRRLATTLAAIAGVLGSLLALAGALAQPAAAQATEPSFFTPEVTLGVPATHDEQGANFYTGLEFEVAFQRSTESPAGCSEAGTLRFIIAPDGSTDLPPGAGESLIAQPPGSSGDACSYTVVFPPTAGSLRLAEAQQQNVLVSASSPRIFTLYVPVIALITIKTHYPSDVAFGPDDQASYQLSTRTDCGGLLAGEPLLRETIVAPAQPGTSVVYGGLANPSLVAVYADAQASSRCVVEVAELSQSGPCPRTGSRIMAKTLAPGERDFVFEFNYSCQPVTIDQVGQLGAQTAQPAGDWVGSGNQPVDDQPAGGRSGSGQLEDAGLGRAQPATSQPAGNRRIPISNTLVNSSQQGWDVLTFSGQAGTHPAEFVASLDYQVFSLWRWHGATQSWHGWKRDQDSHGLTSLEPGDVLFAKVLLSHIYQSAVEPAAGAFQLQSLSPRYSLVMFAGEQAVPAAEAFDARRVAAAFRWNRQTQNWELYLPGFPQAEVAGVTRFEELNPGDGLFVYNAGLQPVSLDWS